MTIVKLVLVSLSARTFLVVAFARSSDLGVCTYLLFGSDLRLIQIFFVLKGFPLWPCMALLLFNSLTVRCSGSFSIAIDGYYYNDMAISDLCKMQLPTRSPLFRWIWFKILVLGFHYGGMAWHCYCSILTLLFWFTVIHRQYWITSIWHDMAIRRVNLWPLLSANANCESIV